MSRITIVSGPPGSGKSTLAATLAKRAANGVHLVTDQFYDYLAHRIDPSKPQSKAQNETVVAAFMTAAHAYAAGGYDVFVDGVIGPWWLPTLRSTTPDFDYVLLAVDLETALRRTAQRASQPSARPDVVTEMHRQFARDAPRYANWVIDTTDASPDVVLSTYLGRARRGDFRRPE